MRFELSAHGTEQIVTASSSRFTITAFDFGENILPWIVFKKLFVALGI
jgi:hypothetical protein